MSRPQCFVLDFVSLAVLALAVGTLVGLALAGAVLLLAGLRADVLAGLSLLFAARGLYRRHA